MSLTIAILTGRYGDGHIKAAEALRDAMVQLNDRQNINTVLFDVTDLLPQFADKLTKKLFVSGIKRFPSLYDYLYEKTRAESKITTIAKKRLHGLGLGQLYEWLGEKKPDAIISTFPVASGMLSELKELGLIITPIYTVITDHTVHSSWINPYIDHYFVASKLVKRDMIKYGVPESFITVTGIPVHPNFSLPFSKRKVKGKLGLNPDLPCILLAGGGFGVFNKIENLLQELNDLMVPFEVVVICGRNQRLLKRIKKKEVEYLYPLKLLGFVENMHEWMAAADLLVTKPGGITVSEAIAAEVPMLIVRALGGQENDNLHFLLQSGTALYTENPGMLRDKLKKLLTPGSLDVLKQAMIPYQWQKDSAFLVCRKVLEETCALGRTANAAVGDIPVLEPGI
ncbi:processive 1,2-diacylglycerol beta-glucosyltransferase [Scopulibacillus darangshiensis]|uniref:Processive 1,2-diacylglycerol beta-glucosyltransferase n=1 Tax=Scopulibacillus darangshiensis TaxID=442528 RepID=A0A4R2P3S2_9BACL|nr:glycosyltransferase [Scopulibacillus darangshiensis]TCP29420.1 processive 1,2-diacylglycerol beta-glucosyltransferase [Scopulibacillus darangshiensis]